MVAFRKGGWRNGWQEAKGRFYESRKGGGLKEKGG